MLTFLVIVSHHARQTHKSCSTSALPLPCSHFNSQSKITTGSGLSTFNFKLLTSSSSTFKRSNLQTFKASSLLIYILASPSPDSPVPYSPSSHTLPPPPLSSVYSHTY